LSQTDTQALLSKKCTQKCIHKKQCAN